MAAAPPVPASPKDVNEPPAQLQAEQALRHALDLMLPLTRWLLRSGVRYGPFATALKAAFVAVAREELARSGGKTTDSAVSVLSGVHRKDVRLLSAVRQAPASVSPTPVAQLFTRWVTDPRYREAAPSKAWSARPRKLPRSGEAPSFESLAREISTDVHPRTLLEELVRLGLAEVEGEEVVLRAQAFVPAPGQDERTALFAANAADHLNAAVHNLSGRGPKFLEQSVYADGLSAASVEALGLLARELWAGDFERMVAEATARVHGDDALPPEEAGMRMRFGVYYFHEAVGKKEEGDA